MSANNDILLYENPYPYAFNPRKKRRRKNPGVMGSVNKVGRTFFGDLNILEILGAMGGFALCAMVPGYIIKAPDTHLKKIGKIALGLAFAVAAKAALSRVHGGVSKAAFYGGIAGTGALAMKMYSPGTNLINAPRRVATPVVPRVAQPMINAMPPSPPSMGRSTQEEFMPAAQL